MTVAPDPLWQNLLVIALAYVIGSIPFAVIVSRAMGLDDPRSYGSKNPGATNVLRTGNKPAAVLTLLGDALKGCVAIWLAQGLSGAGLSPAVLGAVMVAVFLGHLYPVFLKFQGGKGVATALGVYIALQPWLGVAALATWLIIAVFFRYSSLASLTTALFAPLYYLFGSDVLWRAHAAVTLALFVICGFLYWRHRANISRLLRGQESRIGSKK